MPSVCMCSSTSIAFSSTIVISKTTATSVCSGQLVFLGAWVTRTLLFVKKFFCWFDLLLSSFFPSHCFAFDAIGLGIKAILILSPSSWFPDFQLYINSVIRLGKFV